MHEVPVVQLNLVALTGSADDPAGKYGVANLTAAMQTQGAGSRSALELADAIDFLGADLTATSGIDSSAVRLHVPGRAARRRAADHGRRRAEADVSAGRARAPEAAAAHDLRAGARQSRHNRHARLRPRRCTDRPPLRHGDGGHDRHDAALHHRRSPRVLSRGLSSGQRHDDRRGRCDARARHADAQTSFGGWSAQGAGRIESRQSLPPPVPARQTARSTSSTSRAPPQSQIRIGWVGVPRSTPDYFPIQVLNTVLGGAFSSRLNMNLREKHGYTYGATPPSTCGLGTGPFVAAAGVQTDKTAESLKEFFNELNGILQPVPEDELSRAKNYVALRFPANFETTGDISGRLEAQLVYHLPDDYFAKYVQNIEAVTAADVQRVAQKYLQPDRRRSSWSAIRKRSSPGSRRSILARSRR